MWSSDGPIILTHYLPAGHSADHTQSVFAEDFANVLFRIAVLEQRGREVGYLRNILETLRGRGDAVEVATDGHVIDAGDFHHMIDVRDHVFNRGESFARSADVAAILFGSVVVERFAGDV